MKENKEVADTNVGDIEEAIERLEYIDRTYSYNNYYSIWDLKCIEILLSAYKRVLKENEQLSTEVNSLKKDISNMYDEEVIISIISDNFNLSRNEVLKLLGGE